MLGLKLSLTPECAKLIFGGYYAGVSFALTSAAVIVVTLRRRIMKDAPGIIMFIMCVVIAFIFLVAFFVIAQEELMLALNHLVYHSGVLLFFWLNYHDGDYRFHVWPQWPRAVLTQKLLFAGMLVVNTCIVSMWIIKSRLQIAWNTQYEVALIALLNVVYMMCLAFYSIHAWTLTRVAYPNNPHSANPWMVYLTLLFFLVLSAEIIIFAIISATTDNPPDTSLFPGLVYVFADTVFFLAVMFFISTHTRSSNERFPYRPLSIN